MSKPTPRSYGRAALIGALLALLLVITAGVYVHLGRLETGVAPLAGETEDAQAEAARVARLTVLLAVLLICALLLLLFVIGSYLVIRMGRMLRTPVSGTPTPYVDAWQQYRLTPEQIAAATREEESDRDRGDGARDRGGPPAPPPED